MSFSTNSDKSVEALRAELEKYKSRWAALLERERLAVKIGQEVREQARRLQELERQNAELADQYTAMKKERDLIERHSRSYQQELQNALIRLHSSEARFSELSKQLVAFQQARKTLDQELARAEKSLRERLEWETQREREAMKAELERKAAEQIERHRLRVEEQLRREALRRRPVEIPLVSSDSVDTGPTLELNPDLGLARGSSLDVEII